jgi:DNA-binding NarL/FixJ family response regulator
VTQPRRTGILLDPYPLWLDAIEPVFASVGVSVVGKTTSPEDAAALVDEHKPDLLVAEPVTRDHGNVMPLLRAATHRVPSLRLVVLTRSREPHDMAAAFDAGAIAYVVKTSHPVDIAVAIRQAFDHSIYFLRCMEDRQPAPPSLARNGNGNGNGDVALTKRELEILGLVAEGHSNGVLARLLWVTEETVKFHLSNIYRKIGVANRTEASRWAHLNGLVDDDRIMSREAGAAV